MEHPKYYDELDKMEKKMKNNLIGNYQGYDYEIDEYGYGYKIYLPNGRVDVFQPYAGNRVLEIGDTKERIKLTRSRVYSRIKSIINNGG